MTDLVQRLRWLNPKAEDAREAADLIEAQAAALDEGHEARQTMSRIISEQTKRIAALEAPLQAYLNYLERSLNVGPLTNNPSTEAHLLAALRNALEKKP